MQSKYSSGRPSSSSISTTVSSRGPASPEIRPVSAAIATASPNESNSNENGTEYDPERLAITQSPLNIKRGPNQQRAPPIQNISQTPLAAESRPQPSGPNTPVSNNHVNELGAARCFARRKFRTQRTALNVLSVLRRTVRSGEQSIGTRPQVRPTRSLQPEQSAPPGSP